MRNLVHYSHRQIVIDDGDQDHAHTVQHIALDHDNGYVYVATETLLVACIESSSTRRRWTADLRRLVPDLLPDTFIVDFKFLDSPESLCIAMSSGQILMLRDESECEEVGTVEGGLAAAAWSPDGDTLAVISTLGRLLFIRSADAQDISSLSLECDVPVRTEDPEYPQPTAPPVKELVTENEASVLTPLSSGLAWRGDGRYVVTCTVDHPDLPPRLRVWEWPGARLHALGEPVSNVVPHSITWQPNGRHIYVARSPSVETEGEVTEQVRKGNQAPGAQGQAPEVRHVGAWKRELRRREERDASPELYDVLIFERNGLQHGGFTLALPPTSGGNQKARQEIEQMSWSPDSRVLAIVVQTSSYKSLQLWYRNNWHWYMKYERRFATCSAHDRLPLCWESTIGYDGRGTGSLVALLIGRRPVVGSDNITSGVEKMEFLWDVCVSPRSGTVTVIDGPRLLITPLARGIVPPPLAAITYSLLAPIICVHVVEGDDGTTSDVAKIAAVTSDGQLYILTCQYQDEEDESENEYSITVNKIITISDFIPGTQSTQVRRVLWVKSNLILLVVRALDSLEDSDCLVCFRVADDVETCSSITLSDGIECLYCTQVLDHHGLQAVGCILQTSDGQVWRFDPEVDEAMHPLGMGHKGPFSNHEVDHRFVKLIAIEEIQNSACRQGLGMTMMIALSSTSHLVVWRGTEIVHAVGAVTSVMLRPGGSGGPYLMYTTKTHDLWCCDLSFASVSSRRVEEDATLVAAPATGVRVICQAPRGNLETVSPRPLVLAAVKHALKSDGNNDYDYEEAWSLASANRIDPSIIIQYDWPLGLQEDRVKRLLAAIGSDLEAAEFIGSLKDSMERERLELLCIAVRQAVHSCERLDDDHLHDQSSWLRTELATYAACGDLSTALKMVKTVKEDGTKAGEAEKGLRYLLTHEPEEAVYRAALGAYELELAYMVVTHSTKDPGEALMELQRFAEVEDECVRMAEIDRHLGRYESAVRHLVAAGPPHLEAAIDLARTHGLFPQLADACGILKQNRDQVGSTPSVNAVSAAPTATATENQTSKVLSAWAQEMGSKRGKHEDAALALVAARDTERGLREYRLGGRWRSALALAEVNTETSQETVLSMARRFVVDLEEGHRHAEAAIICLEYLKDVEEGVRLLTEAGEWNEAVRIASRAGQDGDDERVKAKVRSSLVSAAISAAATKIETLLEDIGKIEEYCNRLRELRSKRAAMKAVVEGDKDQQEYWGKDFYEGDGRSDVTGTTIFVPSQMHTGTGTGSVTTVGGKAGKKGKGKKASKSGKIRRGSPQEESAIARLLLAMHPPSAVFRETGELTEVLVMFGRLADAARLQGGLKTLVDVHLQAREELLRSPPPGMGLDGTISVETIQIARERGGEAAVVALLVAAASVPGEDLSRRAAECAAAARSVPWKWEILRHSQTV